MSLIEHMIKSGWTRSFSCGQENDLISRQAAIDAIRKHKTLYEADHGWDKTTLDALDTAIKALRQPERKRGRWYDIGSLSCRCSECGCKSLKEYSFCPNCGADMRGEQL